MFKIKKPYLLIGINPLNACSAAADKVLSFIYLPFTKNIWWDLLDLHISGFPITPETVIPFNSYSTSKIASATSFP